MKYILPIALLLLFLVSACSEDDENPKEAKKSNFSEPEEYMENPSVTAAINESGISINKGDNPPPLAGTYLAKGKVVDASSLVNSIVGLPINSEIKLYNQTTSGKIDFQEKRWGLQFGEVVVTLPGITGGSPFGRNPGKAGARQGYPTTLP